MNLLWKLVRSHLSVWQLGGFFVANLAGMAIILVGVQFYCDVLPVFQGKDSFFKKEYLIVAKPVSTMGVLWGDKGTFSDKDVEGIRRQPFAQSVGAFQSSQFDVSASLGMQGTGFRVSTEMFFESVPDPYVDVDSERWHYVPGSRSIPIIIPRNYLNLYNFGFAQSRKLPKLSEGLLSVLRLDIRLSGPGGSEDFEGRIIGFSNRLNTILVPETFMTWANARFAPGKKAPPSRLIVEVANPADQRMVDFLKKHRYEVEGNGLDAGKATGFLRVVVGIVLAVGTVITLLSFYILMLSIYLLLQKNLSKLQNLLLLGYSPARVALPYQLLAALLNVLVWMVATGMAVAFRHLYLERMDALFPALDKGSIVPMCMVGGILCVGVIVVNSCIIRQKLNRIWKTK